MLRQRTLQGGKRIPTTIRFRPKAAAEVHQTETAMEDFEHLIRSADAGSGLKRHLFQKAALTLKLLQQIGLALSGAAQPEQVRQTTCFQWIATFKPCDH